LAIALVAAVGVGLFGRRLLDAWRTARAATVVVLPFTNVGGDPANRAFADGLMEVLTSKLTQLEPFFGRPLWVIPASEVRDRDTESASAARREFAATLAVSGSVQRQRDTISLTLNLVDATTLRQVHSAVVRGPVGDLALWQDGIVDRVAGMLDLDMRPPVRKVLEEGATTEADAYDLYVQGRGYLQRTESVDDARKAADVFRDAVDRDPRFALGYAGMAEAYWRLYNETADTSWVRLATAASQRALALNDSIPAVWVTLGLIHNGIGQYANAIADLEHAVALDPSSSAALSRLARAYEGVKQLAKAEATYRRAIAIKPYDWRAHNVLGVFYYHQSRYEDAAREFLQVTELNPEEVRGYTNAGGILFYLDRWDEARRLLEHALEIDSTNESASSNLGTIDFYEGRYRDAARDFGRAVRQARENHLYWGNLGDALYWIPEREQSREAYRRAITLAQGAYHVNASDAQALSSLVRYHAILGDTTEALEWLRKLTPLVQLDANVMFNVAWSMEVLGNRDAALDWLGRAIKAGCSRKIIEGSPDLRDLRNDPRYRALVAP
jgi:tetratricopeptide (TPR) repeat protein/TolB-like protein